MQLLIAVIMTAFLYGIVPMLVVTFSHEIQKRRFKTICIVWCVVAAILFIALNAYFETGNTASYMPAVIWGWVFYKIGCSIIDKRSSKKLPAPEQTQQAAETKPSLKRAVKPELETWYTCPQCGSLVHIGDTCDCGFVPPLKIPKTAIFRARYNVFVPIIIIVLSIAAVWGWFERSELQMRNEYLTETLADTKRELDLAHEDILLSDSKLEEAEKIISDLREMAKELREENMQYAANGKKISKVSQLLQHGEIVNPYTEEPMLSIDDFINYVKMFNRSIKWGSPLDWIIVP